MISFLCCVIGYGYLLQERLGSLRVLTVHSVMPKCTFDLILSTWALLLYVNSLSLSLSKKHRQLLFKLSCWDVLFIFIIKCYWSIITSSISLSLTLCWFFQDALDSGNCDRIRILMRFLTVMVCMILMLFGYLGLVFYMM